MKPVLPTPNADTAIKHGTNVRWTWLKGMYVVDMLGAGVPGLATIVAPQWVADTLFAEAVQDPVTLRMVGSVWLAIGGLSALGLRHPLRFAPIFPLQAVYKSIWLATVAPTLLRGHRQDVLPLAVVFALWVVGDLIATPYGYICGKGTDDADTLALS